MFTFPRPKSQVRNQITLKGFSSHRAKLEFSLVPTFYGAIRSVSIVIVLYFLGFFLSLDFLKVSPLIFFTDTYTRFN